MMSKEIELAYSEYATMHKNKELLKDLRDDDAIAVWESINNMREAFSAVQDQVSNVARQIKEINKETDLKKNKIRNNKKLSDSEKEDKMKKLVEELDVENVAKLQGLSEELAGIKKKKKKVKINVLSTAVLKKYDLVTIEVLDAFNPIIEKAEVEEAA